MCPQHQYQPLGYGDRADPEIAKPSDGEIVIHRTTGIVKSLMPMHTPKAVPYVFMIVGTTQINAFGRRREMATDDLLNCPVTAWWEQPSPQGWRFLRWVQRR